jgi:hypothetical protein
MQNLIQIVMQKWGRAAARQVSNRDALLLTTSSMMAMLLVGCGGRDSAEEELYNQDPSLISQDLSFEDGAFHLTVVASDADSDSLSFMITRVEATNIGNSLSIQDLDSNEVSLGEDIVMSSTSGGNPSMQLKFIPDTQGDLCGGTLEVGFTVTDGEGGQFPSSLTVSSDACSLGINYSTASSKDIIEDILAKIGSDLDGIKAAILAAVNDEDTPGYEISAEKVLAIHGEDDSGNWAGVKFQYSDSDDVFIVALKVLGGDGVDTNSSVEIKGDAGSYTYADRGMVIEIPFAVLVYPDDTGKVVVGLAQQYPFSPLLGVNQVWDMQDDVNDKLHVQLKSSESVYLASAADAQSWAYSTLGTEITFPGISEANDGIEFILEHDFNYNDYHNILVNVDPSVLTSGDGIARLKNELTHFSQILGTMYSSEDADQDSFLVGEKNCQC